MGQIDPAAVAVDLRPEVDVAVIGAGIAGLAAARTLASAGLRVRIMEKSRGLGGRASTRRSGVHAFDTGAQYFTARETRFRAELARWLTRSIAALWQGRIVTLGADGAADCTPCERYVGVPGMSALARELARGLDPITEAFVASCERRAGYWELLDARGGLLARAPRLIVSAPPAQAAALLGARSPLGAQAASAAMHPCWAVMVAFERRVEVDFDGAFCAGPELSWAARDSSKPGRAGGERWVLHASQAWSQRELEADPLEVAPRILDAFARELGRALPPATHLFAHRWRFAAPVDLVASASAVDPRQGLALAGDWLAGGRVEGAYLSGLAAAEALLEHPSTTSL